MADIIKLRRDTAANWTAANPILTEGEMGIETDTKLQKNGDGTTAWNSLPYMKVECKSSIGDSEVEPMSQKAVTDEIVNNGSAFDISAYNATDGVLAKYADLTAALTALNALPNVYKRGGMSVKYVQSSDNKYIQARCMADEFTTDVTQWQGVDDEPTAGSHNLVESGGVAKITDSLNKDLKLLRSDSGEFYKEIKTMPFVSIQEDKYASTTGSELPASDWNLYVVPVSAGMKFDITAYAGISIPLWVQRAGTTAIAYSEDSSSVSKKNEIVTIQEGVDNICINSRGKNQSDINAVSIKENVKSLDWKSIYTDNESLPEYLSGLPKAENDLVGSMLYNTVLSSYYYNSDGDIGTDSKLARTTPIAIASFDNIIFLDNTLNYKIWSVFAWNTNGDFLGYKSIKSNTISSAEILTWRSSAYKVAFNLYGSSPVDLTEDNTADWKLSTNDGLIFKVNSLKNSQVSISEKQDEIETSLFGSIYKDVVLGSYYYNSDGDIGTGSKFARTDKIELNSFDYLKFNDNDLEYKIWVAFFFNENNQYLGYYNIRGNHISSFELKQRKPAAYTVAFNLYGTYPVDLTDENTADWQLIFQGDSISERIDTLESGTPVMNNIFDCKLVPDTVSFIRTELNDNYDIITSFKIKRYGDSTTNPVFNFDKVSLLNKSTQEITTVHDCSDDITPARYNNTYIGGNHGDSDVRIITCNGHGKTYVDIGSIWSDGTHQCTIVGIIDSNKLLMLGENNLTYPLFTFNTEMFASSVTLTHVSGATHTESISISSVGSTQWRPATSEGIIHIYADGKEILSEDIYHFAHLDICEEYDIYNPASVLEKIQEGVGTFTSNPEPNQFSDADKVARHSIIYGFNSAKEWTIATDFVAFQDINISYFGFTQQAALEGNLSMYIPKVLPINNGQETIDFRTIVPYNSVPQAMDFTGTYWENPLLPPDRWTQISQYIAISSGYLFDFGVGGSARKDSVNNAINLYTTGKCYPHGIDSKITVVGGDSFSAVVWRNYKDVATVNTDGIISVNTVKYNDKYYLYADFSSYGLYEIELPCSFIGKKIEVLEKRDNVELISSLSNSRILVKVASSTPNYGYLVAKLD